MYIRIRAGEVNNGSGEGVEVAERRAVSGRRRQEAGGKCVAWRHREPDEIRQVERLGRDGATEQKPEKVAQAASSTDFVNNRNYFSMKDIT